MATDYIDLQRDIVRLGELFNGVTQAQIRFNDGTNEDSRLQWEAIAEIRDDMLALSNRLENLTAFVTSNPAEVAAKIVTDANRQTLHEVRDDG